MALRLSAHTKARGDTMDTTNRSAVSEAKDSDFDVDIQSCSTMDCTGLIPSLPQSKAEVEHYNQLYQFLPTQVLDSEIR